MTRSLIIWVTIAVLPAAAGATPTITFDPSNPGINPYTKGPLTRTWKWTCTDSAKVFPLKARWVAPAAGIFLRGSMGTVNSRKGAWNAQINRNPNDGHRVSPGCCRMPNIDLRKGGIGLPTP